MSIGYVESPNTCSLVSSGNEGETTILSLSILGAIAGSYSAILVLAEELGGAKENPVATRVSNNLRSLSRMRSYSACFYYS